MMHKPAEALEKISINILTCIFNLPVSLKQPAHLTARRV